MLDNIFIIIAFIGLFIWRLIISSPKNIGKVGEWRVALKLDWLPKEYIVLNDIMLQTQHGTTQIDHIVVSPYGIFIIETKNYKGWIFGHENSEEWKQSLLGRKRIWGWSSEQHKFRNPIRQNQAHTRAIKSLISDIGDFQIISIVVFSDSADLRITTPNHTVINWRELRDTIKYHSHHCINEPYVKLIAGRISSANIIDKETRECHIQSVQQIQQQKGQMLNERTCPLCHSQLVERQGKYGKFLGCSNYPMCKYTHKI